MGAERGRRRQREWVKRVKRGSHGEYPLMAEGHEEYYTAQPR